MSKQNIEQRNSSKFGKKYSHTGNKPLVPHINDPKVMVTQKVRRAQESNKSWLSLDTNILHGSLPINKRHGSVESLKYFLTASIGFVKYYDWVHRRKLYPSSSRSTSIWWGLGYLWFVVWWEGVCMASLSRPPVNLPSLWNSRGGTASL